MLYYYRTDLSRYTGDVYPKAVVINSVAELDDYYEKNKDTYQFQLRHRRRLSMLEDVFEKKSRYSDRFFNSRPLLFIVLEEGSGSISHVVDSTKTENGEISVNIIRVIPEVCTAEMAQWHIVLFWDKISVNKDIKVVFHDKYLSEQRKSN